MEWNLPYLTREHKSLVMLMKEFCEREVDAKALNKLADMPIPPNAMWEHLDLGSRGICSARPTTPG